MIPTITIKKKKVLDIFIISNFFFLVLDIFYAHSINSFGHKAEWIPFYFSIAAFVILSINFFINRPAKIWITGIMGFLSILVGTMGLYYHLESQFFQDLSIKSLVYTAPFIAPLSYTALGLLLMLNLLVSSLTRDYGKWIITLAYFGFAGNFILSLFDHAQNGFFFVSEWIPVLSSALVLGFIPFGLANRTIPILKATIKTIIYIQIFVGVLGAILHLYSVLNDSTGTLIESILYGAPILAPLLFSNLAVLMLFGWYCVVTEGKLIQIGRGFHPTH